MRACNFSMIPNDTLTSQLAKNIFVRKLKVRMAASVKSALVLMSRLMPGGVQHGSCVLQCNDGVPPPSPHLTHPLPPHPPHTPIHAGDPSKQCFINRWVPTVEIMKAHYAQHTITLFVTNQPAICAEEVGRQMSCVNQKIPKTLVRVGFGLFRKR